MSGAMRIGYFGPEGTFTHEALIAATAASEQFELVPLPTIYDTVMAVHDREVSGRSFRWRTRSKAR